MAAYLIADVDVHDPVAYEEYKAAIPPLVRKHGGETLARGGAIEVFEGDWRPSRLVLFRFASMERAARFSRRSRISPLEGASPEGRARKPHRRRRRLGIYRAATARER